MFASLVPGIIPGVPNPFLLAQSSNQSHGLFSKASSNVEAFPETSTFYASTIDVAESGLMCELLWSDPQAACGISPSKQGVGIEFGPDVTKSFLSRNKLEYIIRSHEVKAEGYEVTHDGKCITVFSAPNYCDTMGNKGAFITMNGIDMKPKFVTYSAVPHPNVKPMAYASSLLAFM